MNRRQFLTTSLLAAPALLSLSSLPALALTAGSTLIEAPGLTASGSFETDGLTPGGNARLESLFSAGPSVDAQFGPNAVDRIVAASQGDRFAVRYVGFNGIADYWAEWTLTQAAASGARARFTIDGALDATASALIGANQAPGVGVAAMIVAAISAGATLRGGNSTSLRTLVTPRATPSGMAFGLEVTVRT